MDQFREANFFSRNFFRDENSSTESENHAESDDINGMDTFILTSLAPISLFFPCKEGRMSHHKGGHVHYNITFNIGVIRLKDYLNFKMLHALGLLHEHQRPDRDEYIIVDMAAAARYKSVPQQLKKACFH